MVGSKNPQVFIHLFIYSSCNPEKPWDPKMIWKDVIYALDTQSGSCTKKQVKVLHFKAIKSKYYQ